MAIGTAAARRDWTVAVLRGGAIVAGVGFLVGLVLAVGHGGAVAGSVVIESVPGGIMALDPTSWLTAASIVLIATPAVGLVTTAAEFVPVDRRSVAVCALLLLIFGTSLLLATRG